MNNAVLSGHVTRNPQINVSQSNVKVARYTLAVNRRFKKEGQQNADFINCVAFAKAADFVENYVKQGTGLMISGRIQTGSYTNKDGVKIYTTDVVVDNHEFMGSKSQESQQTPAMPTPANASSDGFMNIPQGLEEELPFA